MYALESLRSDNVQRPPFRPVGHLKLRPLVLGVRNFKEMLSDRGNWVVHSTIHRWVVNF